MNAARKRRVRQRICKAIVRPQVGKLSPSRGSVLAEVGLNSSQHGRRLQAQGHIVGTSQRYAERDRRSKLRCLWSCLLVELDAVPKAEPLPVLSADAAESNLLSLPSMKPNVVAAVARAATCAAMTAREAVIVASASASVPRNPGRRGPVDGNDISCIWRTNVPIVCQSISFSCWI